MFIKPGPGATQLPALIRVAHPLRPFVPPCLPAFLPACLRAFPDRSDASPFLLTSPLTFAHRPTKLQRTL